VAEYFRLVRAGKQPQSTNGRVARRFTVTAALERRRIAHSKDLFVAFTSGAHSGTQPQKVRFVRIVSIADFTSWASRNHKRRQ
jgi:hypothetical protein